MRPSTDITSKLTSRAPFNDNATARLVLNGLGLTVVKPKESVAGKSIEIVISDNGIGFEPENANKIFEVFQRLHGRGEYSGTGIGLAIVRRIVDRHRGTITAISEVGVGTTFTIRLRTDLDKEKALYDAA